MSVVAEAIARYHKLIESEPYIDLAWARTLEDRIRTEKLGGRPISPVLRPHFLTGRDYTALVKASETLLSAISRVFQMAIANPALLARLQLLPAERMLAVAEPGYDPGAVTALLDTSMAGGIIRFAGYSADIPAGVLYGEALADLYYDAPPVKEFRKKYKLTKTAGLKHLAAAMFKAYKQSGGKNKKPNIAVMEIRQPLQPASASEYAPLVEFLNREGYATESVTPEQLEYKNNQLRRGEFVIDIVLRRVRLQEFLIRFDLNHPLVRAYKDRSVCVIDSFRAELGSKRVIFDLLTDDEIAAKLPAAERKVIKDHVPWTRLVQAAKTTYKGRSVDLPDFVMKNRAKLVLRTNDENAGIPAVRGADVDEGAWERALRQAMRTASVVQEAVPQMHAVFPLLQYGSLVMKDMAIHVHPHAFLGKVQGVSSWLAVAGATGFSTLTGLAPTFLLAGK
jgi:hypothetical protein